MDHQTGCGHTNCNVTNTNQSVCQTLSEMDWERSLWNAAFYGEEERVCNLLSKSRNPRDVVNAADLSGYTPLHYAARKGQVTICKILLQNGASINAQTRCGKATALHKAAAAGHAPTVNYLIESGADLKMQDNDGKTVLHKAIENNHFNLVEILLNASPDLKNIPDSGGKLPNIAPENKTLEKP